MIACILALMATTYIKHTMPHSKYRKYIHYSAVLLGIGFVSGLFLWSVSGQTLTLAVALTLATCAQIDSDFGFNQSLFWDYVLPPIIFNAGYSMSQRRFFSNISTITLYGVTLPPRCPTPPPERL